MERLERIFLTSMLEYQLDRGALRGGNGIVGVWARSLVISTVVDIRVGDISWNVDRHFLSLRIFGIYSLSRYHNQSMHSFCAFL